LAYENKLSGRAQRLLLSSLHRQYARKQSRVAPLLSLDQTGYKFCIKLNFKTKIFLNNLTDIFLTGIINEFSRFIGQFKTQKNVKCFQHSTTPLEKSNSSTPSFSSPDPQKNDEIRPKKNNIFKPISGKAILSLPGSKMVDYMVSETILDDLKSKNFSFIAHVDDIDLLNYPEENYVHASIHSMILLIIFQLQQQER